MLRKLMKYEIKTTSRTLLPLYCALIIFALLNKLFFFSSFSIKRNIGPIYALFSSISISAYGVIMTSIFIVTLFIIIQRFYKNLLGHEGYLMHTLPLETYKNILNKLIIAVFWIIISCIVALISIGIMFASTDSIELLFTNFIPEILNTFGKYGLTPFILCLEFFIITLFALCEIILKIYASISIGHLFRKAKTLWSIGAFITINIIENNINFCFGKLNLPNLHLRSINAGIIIEKTFLIVIIVLSIYIIIYFIITNYILKNKLNLE